MTSDAGDQSWYWDLTANRAVPAAERGKGDNNLGPYDSKAEAENWRSKVESRNDQWDDSDDDWNDPPAE
jgi:hypothetical protein